MTKEYGDGDWISANKAVNLYSSIRGGKESVRSALAAALRDGELKSCARGRYISTERSVNKAWDKIRKEFPQEDLAGPTIELGPKIWRSSESVGKKIEENGDGLRISLRSPLARSPASVAC